MDSEAPKAEARQSQIAIALQKLDRAELPLGKGPFPPELAKFSWAAFFFPGLWAIRRGVWWVIVVSLIPAFGGSVARTMLPSLIGTPVWSVGAVLVNAFFATFAVWLGVNGNRMAWSAASRSELARNGMTLGKLLDGEVTWIGFGVLLELLVVASALFPELRHSLGARGGISVVIDLVSLCVAVYLARDVDGSLWQMLSRTRSV